MVFGASGRSLLCGRNLIPALNAPWTAVSIRSRMEFVESIVGTDLLNFVVAAVWVVAFSIHPLRMARSVANWKIGCEYCLWALFKVRVCQWWRYIT